MIAAIVVIDYKIYIVMEELKMQNGLLLQLVTGL